MTVSQPEQADMQQEKRDNLILTYSLGAIHALLFSASMGYPIFAIPARFTRVLSSLLQISNGGAAIFFLAISHASLFYPDALKMEPIFFEVCRHVCFVLAVIYSGLASWALLNTDLSDMTYSSAYHYLVVVPMSHIPIHSIVIACMLCWAGYLGIRVFRAN